MNDIGAFILDNGLYKIAIGFIEDILCKSCAKPEYHDGYIDGLLQFVKCFVLIISLKDTLKILIMSTAGNWIILKVQSESLKQKTNRNRRAVPMKRN